MNSTFRIKVGETRRTITLSLDETADGVTLPVPHDDVVSVTMTLAMVAGFSRNGKGELYEVALAGPGEEFEREMTAGAEDGEWFYRPEEEDFEEGGGLAAGRYSVVLDVVMADGTTAPVPSVGVNYLVVEPRR